MAKGKRIDREERTIRAMIELYCRQNHGCSAICSDCSELTEYAVVRLTSCPFGGEKTTCANCPVHCYQPRMRDKIRKVMRYAGPRMIVRHPLLTLLHVWDGRRRAAIKKRSA